MPDRETWRFINSFAPWLSAIATAIAAATALYLAQWDRRIRLSVRASLRIQLIQGGGLGHGDRFVSINITNKGRRTTSVTTLGFKFPLVKPGELWLHSHLGSTLPAKLEDGQDAAFLSPLDEFCTGLFGGFEPTYFFPFPRLRLRLARCIVATSHGKTFVCPLTPDLRKEIRIRAAGLVKAR